MVEQERRRTQGAKAKASRTTIKKTSKRTGAQRPEWNVDAAAKIEESALEGTIKTEYSKAVASTSQVGSTVKKSRTKRKGAFHFSPIKTPPSKQTGAKHVRVVTFIVNSLCL